MEYYNSISAGYNELYGEEQLSKLSIIKNAIKTGKNTSILDVGCGTGISSRFECRVVGIDPSIELLKQNKSSKVLGAAENLPFKSSSFEYVISVTSIHNFSDIEKSLSEMKRVGMKYFVFSVLKKSNKFDNIKRLIEKSFKVERKVKHAQDVIFFCKKQSFIYQK